MRGKKRLPPTEWESEAAAPETSSSAATAATATATAVAKRPKVPALTGVIVEALKMDGLQRLCSTLEPLLRRIVSEEVERALTELSCAKLNGSSSPLRIDGPVGRKLQLHFRSRMHPHLFTGGKVEGEQGAAIHVVLLDANTGMVVSSGPESMAKLNVMVLEGDFNDEADDDWSQERFESYEVKEREGKRPLLTGHLQVTLKGGVGTLGELIFTDNSSWTRSRKFRLGLKLADGCCDGIRIREAKTEAFAVKDHRGELYKKHYPPALHDEVWRLERIAKDGALHKKLVSANIQTVEDFLRFLVRDPRRLRNILGSAVSNKMWENTVEHAKTCVLSEKVYVYYDETRSTGAVFNHIYELRGLISNGQFLSVESLSHDQKVSVDLLVKRAYDDWSHAIEYDGHDLLNSEKSSQKAQHAATTDCISPLGHCFMPTAQPEGCYSSSTGTRLQNEGAHSNRSGLMVLATPQTSYGSACASGDWPHVQEEQNFDHFKEQIRIRSSEILEHGDMQCLLSSFNTGGVGGFATSSEAHYSYPNAHFEPQSECMFGQEHNRNNAKAAISWLKLKAAFRWGIFIRKKAAERRAQLVELD